MPITTPCERCQRVGLVRTERIITGEKITLSYICGACEHTWQIIQPDPRRHPPRAAPGPQKDRRSA